MSITTRTLLITVIGSLLFLFVVFYIYSNINTLTTISYIQLANGTKIFSQNKNVPIKDKTSTSNTNLGFIHAFIASISVIVVSEIGDKTFFIAAIMAMRHSRLTIYLGAMTALGAMTILSALLGNIVTKFIPRIYTYYLSSVLFAGFGIKMLKDGYEMSPDEGTEEYEEVQHEVEKAEANDDLESGGNDTANNNSNKGQQQQPRLAQKDALSTIVGFIRRYLSPIFLQACIMTFLAVNISTRIHILYIYICIFLFRNGEIDLK